MLVQKNRCRKNTAMTIKRQLFVSNIRVVLVTLIGLVLAVLAVRIVLLSLSDNWGVDFCDLMGMRRHQPEWWGGGLKTFVFFTLFVVIISAINNLLTLRMINNIVRPLKALSEGVNQIHDINLEYRVNYQNNDEFRPICDAFDEMAAKLETFAAEQRKNEANRRELIAGISHDLRTPLTSIKGYLEGLEAGVASTSAMREKYFATIKSKASDLEYIIEQLFLFSKLDTDEFPLTLRRVALDPVIRSLIAEIAGEYATRGLDIHLAPHQTAPMSDTAAIPPDITISADTLHLRNVIINILENSVVHKTKERGRIDISASWNGDAHDTITLRFADDGPGVAADTLGKLFDAHYRADPARNKKGSGLGLAISSKIIERMGGTCRAELPETGGLAIIMCLPAERGP